MNPREKAKDLIRLAADERTPENERMAAAVRAVALIAKHNLLDNPLDGVVDKLRGEHVAPTMRAAAKIYDIFKDPDVQEGFNVVRDVAREYGKRRRSTRARRG